MVITERSKRVEQLKAGERTLLQEAHELVINEDYPDLEEALDFIMDQENPGSVLASMIATEDYEQCDRMVKEKFEILQGLNGMN